MSYQINFVPIVEKNIKKWKKSNPIIHQKLIRILLDIAEHPREGIGHPEPLKNGNDMRYSRHITANDRIIYEIYDDVITVLVIQVGGHYDDK